MIDELKIRQDFPIFKNLPDLVYLDSTATSLKPKQVINKMLEYYEQYSANIFRGIYKLSQKATDEYELVRQKVTEFINGNSSSEVVFVRNCTEAINLVAYAWGENNLKVNDEIWSTEMEHHSNLIPWQNLAKKKNLNLQFLQFNRINGELELEKLATLTDKTKLLAITHVSNVLGTINPIKHIVQQVKEKNPQCLVLVDGAQAVPHLKVDVKDLGADFYTFSAHKMLGPTGVGILWAKQEILDSMPPFLFGGEMIKEVQLNESTYTDIPHRFEAGTPDIGGVIGLGAAIDYLNNINMEEVRVHEIKITDYALRQLEHLANVTIYGPKEAEKRGGVIAFNVDGIHAHDLAQVLDKDNVCIRSGHHCAMPLHTALGITASARASFYIYNTLEDVDKLVEGIKKAQKIFINL